MLKLFCSLESKSAEIMSERNRKLGIGEERGSEADLGSK